MALTGIDVYKIFAYENQFGLVPTLLPAIDHGMRKNKCQNLDCVVHRLDT